MTRPSDENQRLLSTDELRSLVFYNPENGQMTWRDGQRAGYQVGYAKDGYRQAEFTGRRRFFVHRLAWLYAYGEWPPGFIDHANGDRSDNRIVNLRIATPTQNMANRRAQGGRTLKGITRAYGGKWRAMISIYGRQTVIGTFDTAEEAHAAYFKRAIEVHGEFARAV